MLFKCVTDHREITAALKGTNTSAWAKILMSRISPINDHKCSLPLVKLYVCDLHISLVQFIIVLKHFFLKINVKRFKFDKNKWTAFTFPNKIPSHCHTVQFVKNTKSMWYQNGNRSLPTIKSFKLPYTWNWKLEQVQYIFHFLGLFFLDMPHRSYIMSHFL